MEDSRSKYINEDLLLKLIEMEFSINGSKKALYLNKNNLEASIEWIFKHQNDPDFEEEMKIEDEPKLEENKQMIEESIDSVSKDVIKISIQDENKKNNKKSVEEYIFNYTKNSDGNES